MELRIAKSALDDLQAIQEYYKDQDVPQIGDQYVAAILTHFEMLQPHPDAGRVVPEFNLDHIRELIHTPFRAVYLRQEIEVVLIRVWRSERQLILPDNESLTTHNPIGLR
ncbi:MAG: type II toxin-antitoxin system RelE/ParE family toxin [Natronospirillum sp.]|uniref:type II toxin-antitoxin system RelE/ParE family toxin n=1 Tax=Natronospirillum sp. TaxID=2812955 RepID=UPI0025D960F1|nr:type II toxin-antitoxin system RelE/ParE family toxin [Natronospirillum sp.]MCH8552113.1 type II toxin-antitoxin system RelE/ParE family toxin [Natronospirillum sp.]